MDPRPLTEQRPIPAPPRDVRWLAAFGRRAALGLCGGLLLLAGLIVIVSLLVRGAGLPFEDHALDAECSTTQGEILQRQPTAMHVPEGEIVRLRFRYRVAGQALDGTSYGVGNTLAPGSTQPVEFLRREPDISRLRGTTRAVPAPIPWPLALTLAAIGVFCLMAWLRASVGQRHLLREGVLTMGEVESARPVSLVSPSQVAVEFSFRDRERKLHRGRQWRPAKTPLGRALLAGERSVHVIHDPGRPQRNSLAGPEDFEPAHGTS